MSERTTQLEALVRAHRFVPNKLRTNVSSDLRWSGRKPFLRTAILSNTLSSGPIVDLCRQMLGDDINRATLNKNLTCEAHRDAKSNVGRLSHIIFFGEYDNSDGAGSLVLEDGRQFIEKGVWHSFDGSALLHWNVPFRTGEVGDKWSVVAWRGQMSRKLVPPPDKAVMTTVLTRVPDMSSSADFEGVQQRLWDLAAELSALSAEDLATRKPWLAAHDAELEAVQERLRDMAEELGALARSGG